MTNKWIYIVAPTRQSFVDWCRDNDRHQNEKELVHVRQPLTMLGRTIRANDEVHYHDVHNFNQKVFNEIQHEITIRSMKNERAI